MDYQRRQSRDQTEIFCLEQHIPEDSFVRVVDAFVDSLDLQQFKFKNSRLNREGRPPFDPADLLKLYIYGYRHGIRSSRKLARACQTNIEVWWLIGKLQPSYKTIAAFRRQNKSRFRQVFRTLTLTLQGWDLIEAQTIAVDSVKIRAQNSRKNNYNKAKLERHLDYIDDQIDKVLEEFESADAADDHEKFDALMQRRHEYEQLQNQLTESGDTQISSTDPDARMLPLRRKITEVSYASQTAVEGTNKLIVNYEVTNQRDTHALSSIAKDTKELLGVQNMDVLADKGYHTGSELQACEEAGISTYVAPRATSPGTTAHFPKSEFQYDAEQDHYICPAGKHLVSNGSWYQKNNGSGRNAYKIKRYVSTNKVCSACPVQDQCIGKGTQRQRQGRAIERSEYEAAITENAKRVENRKGYYLRRQAIVEHPFGTLKRQWGFTHTLMRRLEKVEAEVGIGYIGYNLVRCCAILSPLELIKRFKSAILCIFELWRVLARVRRIKFKSIILVVRCILGGRGMRRCFVG